MRQNILIGIAFGVLCTFGVAEDTVPASASLLPLNDDTAAPYLAVYRWGQAGLVHGLYDGYATWLNRSVIWAEDFMPNDRWDAIEGGGWQLGPWRDWVNAKPGRRLILSVPVLVGGWDNKGPSDGLAAHIPISLEEGAKGTYNIYFQHLAEKLVKYNLGNTVLRIGWEFNGGWYDWRAQGAAKAEAFAGYYKQIVTTMRAVPGAQNLKFCWNPAMEPWWPYPPEKAYPGDDVVDYVGVDVYDQCWAKDTYPIPPTATADEALTRQKLTWNSIIDNDTAGLKFWTKFAADHKKPLAIPEWGACIRKDQHGGGDNAFFIEQMYRFIQDPANNVAFACYFDVTAGDGDHRLIDETSHKDPTQILPTKLPLSAAKYKELFTLKGTQTASAAPAPTPAPKSP